MINIGITGHRPHRLKVSERKLAARVRGVLKGLMAGAGASKSRSAPVLNIISPLAEGCDRIIAREALTLKQRLTALLPFARRDYETTFNDTTTTAEFRSLLKQADERVELKGSLKRAEASYVAVGMVTLARSDLIVTIWDGKPAQGRGGTPEILQNAIEWGIPIIWIDAVRGRKPMLLLAKRRGKTVPHLEGLAKRSKPLTAASYRAIVSAAVTDHIQAE